jgi:hypothetical protein
LPLLRFLFENIGIKSWRWQTAKLPKSRNISKRKSTNIRRYKHVNININIRRDDIGLNEERFDPMTSGPIKWHQTRWDEIRLDWIRLDWVDLMDLRNSR